MPFPLIPIIAVAPQIIKAVGSLFSKKKRAAIQPKVKAGALTSAIAALSIVGLRVAGAPVDEFYPDIQNAAIVLAGFIGAWVKDNSPPS